MQDRSSDDVDARSGYEVVEALTRWDAFGAVWRVLERDASQVTIGLFRCDAGEEVGRIISADREVTAFIDRHKSAD